MPSSVKLWAEGYIAEFLDNAKSINNVISRADKNPLGSAAGYGTPGLNIDRDLTTKKLGFKSTHEPVTAVQLSRGKAEAEMIFELTMILGDLAKLASDIILFYSYEFSFLEIKKNIIVEIQLKLFSIKLIFINLEKQVKQLTLKVT